MISKEFKRILETRKFEAERVANKNKQLILSNSEAKGIYQKEIDLRLKKARAEVFEEEFDEKELTKTQKQFDVVLKKLGLTREDLEPKYHCKKCSDTGMIEGVECECLKTLRSEFNKQNSLIHNFHDFDEINYDYITNEKTKGLIQKLKNFSQNENKYLGITLCSQAGSGKTFILQCMANEFIKRGKNVLMETSFKINNDFLKIHTTFNEDKINLLNKYLLPDVLIIDDLGTEPIYNNVTKEYLYLILNQRGVDRKITLISTNLYPSDFQNRYGPRSASRIIDKTKNLIFSFDNCDIRLLKLNKNI